jgi:hypothetical protein
MGECSYVGTYALNDRNGKSVMLVSQCDGTRRVAMESCLLGRQMHRHPRLCSAAYRRENCPAEPGMPSTKLWSRRTRLCPDLRETLFEHKASRTLSLRSRRRSPPRRVLIEPGQIARHRVRSAIASPPLRQTRRQPSPRIQRAGQTCGSFHNSNMAAYADSVCAASEGSPDLYRVNLL